MRRIWPALVGIGLVAPALTVIAAGAAGYVGLSGLGHALIGAALAYELAVRRRWYVALAALALLAKVAYELITGAPLFAMDLGPAVSQSPLAHATGALVGIALGARSARDAAAAAQEGEELAPGARAVGG